MNQRNDFRADFTNQKCELYERDIRMNGDIQDISGSGMSVLVRNDVFGRFVAIRFALNGKTFYRKTEITRKHLLKSGEYEFGLRFLDQSEKEREELHSLLTSYTGRKAN